MSRGAALGISIITALNLCEVFVFNTSAVVNWLCDFRMITQPLSIAVLAMLATSLLMYSMKPALPGPVWMATLALVTLVAAFAGWELWDVSQRVAENLRQSAMSRPLGVLMLLAVAGMGILVGDSPSAYGRASVMTILGSCTLAVLGFAVVTLQSGSVADAIPKDRLPVILVVGCEVDADGNPSEALVDRVATASKLLLEGHANMLVLSGGPGDGPVTATQAMKKLAIEAGVAETKIVLDPTGDDLIRSVHFAATLPELKQNRRIIAVSHWYQLARLRMLARQANLQAVAVPAEQQHALFGQNTLFAKELAQYLKACCEPARRLALGIPTIDYTELAETEEPLGEDLLSEDLLSEESAPAELAK